MKCIDCKYFKVLYEPFGYEWGTAKCERYNLYTDFQSKHKLKKLTHEQGRIMAEKVALKSGDAELKGGDVKMKVHNIKIFESYADAVLSGDKTFEIRYNDRGFQKGDRLKFQVVEDGHSAFDLKSHGLNDKEFEIAYVHSGLGMADGFVALAIRAIAEEGEQE